ncbi:MAG: hypothetical protein R3B93_01875 [Bacteroidia bacterium]
MTVPLCTIIAQNQQETDSAIHYLNGALTVYEKIGTVVELAEPSLIWLTFSIIFSGTSRRLSTILKH